MGLAYNHTGEAQAAGALIAEHRHMNAAMGIPDIPRLARYPDKEANPLYPIPRLMDARGLERLYDNVMEGSQ